ncbi:MAG: hypothetical protein Sylvanvirus34_8 [Sylvanvirus sp.]|uniref:Uncharacterized protein n=1 Tax=Sylvanvirus sp. TaxID=2487774 RepID=A0A3G5AMF0_9VIRU|nr:MAG: hypothetical protein Sylvanvirus34_8 [Sylvanvirus sp.]
MNRPLTKLVSLIFPDRKKGIESCLVDDIRCQNLIMDYKNFVSKSHELDTRDLYVILVLKAKLKSAWLTKDTFSIRRVDDNDTEIGRLTCGALKRTFQSTSVFKPYNSKASKTQTVIHSDSPHSLIPASYSASNIYVGHYTQNEEKQYLPDLHLPANGWSSYLEQTSFAQKSSTYLLELTRHRYFGYGVKVREPLSLVEAFAICIVRIQNAYRFDVQGGNEIVEQLE